MDQRLHKIIATLSLVLFLITCVYLFGVSYTNSIYFDGIPYDGPFQMFNALRRIADGQVVGRDFQVFHGVGMAFLHSVPFFVFGKNLFASEMSRWLLSVFLFLFTHLMLYRSLGMKWTRAMLLSASLVLLASETEVSTLLYPNISSIGVRSSFPIVTAASLLLVARYKGWEILRKFFSLEIITGFLLALSVWVSTEQGIFSWAAMMVVLIFFHPTKRKISAKILSSLLTTVSFMIFALILFVLVSGKYVFEVLGYSFISVPTDQFWYFGAPPNFFLTSVFDFFHSTIAVGFLVFNICIFFIVLKRFLAHRSGPDRFKYSILLFLTLYGFFSIIPVTGIATSHYLEPMFRIDFLLILFFFLEYIPRMFQMIDRLASKFIKIQSTLINRQVIDVIIVLSLIITTGFWQVKKGNELFQFVKESKKEFHFQDQKIQGVYLSDQWWDYVKGAQQIIGSDAKIENSDMWSTYSGLLESIYGVFHPVSDYIIHALGPGAREDYIQAFSSIRPRYVITIRRSNFIYEEWLQNTTWDFYELLVNNYQPHFVAHAILWQKKDDEWREIPEQWDGEVVLKKGQSVDIPVTITEEGRQVYIVEVFYTVKNPWSKIPLIGGIPRYLVRPQDTLNVQDISLPPYENSWRFPLLVEKDDKPSLELNILPHLPYVEAEISRLRYRKLDTTREIMDTMMEINPKLYENSYLKHRVVETQQ